LFNRQLNNYIASIKAGNPSNIDKCAPISTDKYFLK